MLRNIPRQLSPVFSTCESQVILVRDVFGCYVNLFTKSRYCSSTSTAQNHGEPTPTLHNEVEVNYVRGLPQLTIPLPSRRERCLFTLRPISNNVGDLIQQIQQEDHGIDRVVLKTTDGRRIASSNTIESLMEQDFDLIINDVVHHVQTPPRERLTKEEIERLSDVQNLVFQLYEALHVGEHQLKKERQLLSQLEELQAQLLPLEKKKADIAALSERRTNVLTWTGLGLMAVQFGALARLTWWEYSWDIMEPVTYFVTYGTTMAAFAYYVLTKQEYILPDVRDREYLFSFHKKARKVGFDVAKYNQLKDNISQIEQDLKTLRDPFRFRPSTHGTQETDNIRNLWNRTQVRLQGLIRPAKP